MQKGPDESLDQMQSGTLMRMLIEYRHALGLLSYCAAPETIEMRHAFAQYIRRIEQAIMSRSYVDNLDSERVSVFGSRASAAVSRNSSR